MHGFQNNFAQPPPPPHHPFSYPHPEHLFFHSLSCISDPPPPRPFSYPHPKHFFFILCLVSLIIPPFSNPHPEHFFFILCLVSLTIPHPFSFPHPEHFFFHSLSCISDLPPLLLPSSRTIFFFILCLVSLTLSYRETSYRSLKRMGGSTSCPWTTILV